MNKLKLYASRAGLVLVVPVGFFIALGFALYSGVKYEITMYWPRIRDDVKNIWATGSGWL